MKTLDLLDKLTFDNARAHAEPILVDDTGRVLRFTLQPGQRLHEHRAPHSPVHIVVLQGKGLFAGEQGEEVLLEPHSLAVFGAGELHRVRALDEDLVFVAFLHRVEAVPTQDHVDSFREETYLTWQM